MDGFILVRNCNCFHQMSSNFSLEESVCLHRQSKMFEQTKMTNYGILTERKVIANVSVSRYCAACNMRGGRAFIRLQAE